MIKYYIVKERLRIMRNGGVKSPPILPKNIVPSFQIIQHKLPPALPAFLTPVLPDVSAILRASNARSACQQKSN
jgi:hypothetical protein